MDFVIVIKSSDMQSEACTIIKVNFAVDPRRRAESKLVDIQYH